MGKNRNKFILALDKVNKSFICYVIYVKVHQKVKCQTLKDFVSDWNSNGYEATLYPIAAQVGLSRGIYDAALRYAEKQNLDFNAEEWQQNKIDTLIEESKNIASYVTEKYNEGKEKDIYKLFENLAINGELDND